MNKFAITEDLSVQLPIRVSEVKVGHEYLICNRHTAGAQIINFAEFKTYQQMIDSGMDQQIINLIVPEGKRECDDCTYYLVAPGAFSQDIIDVLVKRVGFQYQWFKNGFYKECVDSLKNALLQYEHFTTIRKEFGFYHIPFNIENMIKSISEKSTEDLEKNRILLNTFFEFSEEESKWETKDQLIDTIKNR